MTCKQFRDYYLNKNPLHVDHHTRIAVLSHSMNCEECKQLIETKPKVKLTEEEKKFIDNLSKKDIAQLISEMN